MKIYIMTDMEGVSGVQSSQDWCRPGGAYFEEGKKLLSQEINAAIHGFFAAGADEIWVIDGHGPGGVNALLLDRRAIYVRTTVGPHPFGLDSSFDCIAWVGQHAKAGTPFAHLCHTGSFAVIDYQVNGVSIGEFGRMLYCAQELGVTPIFVSGDQAMCEEASTLVKGIETVAVKWGLTPGSGDELDEEGYRNRNRSARHLHPEEARDRIRAGAERALRAFQEDSTRFVSTPVKPPFRKDVWLRGVDGLPGQEIHVTHSTSVIELLNQ